MRTSFLLAPLLLFGTPSFAHAEEAFLPPGVTPTVGLYYGVRFSPVEEAAAATYPVWAGVALHPSPAKVSPFVAFGAEIDTVLLPSDPQQTQGSYTMLMPEMRYGVAFLRSPYGNFANQTFPNAEIYAITAYRPRHEISGAPALRLGIGVSSPLVTVAGLTERCTPIPGSLEFLVDLESRDGRRASPPPVYTLRMGWHF